MDSTYNMIYYVLRKTYSVKDIINGLKLCQDTDKLYMQRNTQTIGELFEDDPDNSI